MRSVDHSPQRALAFTSPSLRRRHGDVSPKLAAVSAKIWLILGVCGSTAACASAESATPEWPRQPSPSYPAAPPTEGPLVESADERKGQSADQDTVVSPPAATGSPLAKEYQGHEPLGTLEGKATYYADSLAGNHTANGDVYDPSAFTAAHKKLPFGTVVRVVRTDTGAATYVRVNDRGPFGSKDRIIDLSKAAAEELQMLKAGVVSVRVEILQQPE